MRCLIIGLICCGFAYRDYDNFMRTKNLNLYSAIGTDRGANINQIDHIIDRYFECQDEFHEGECASLDRSIYRFNATDIK
jgi:hypothetical protein